MRQLCPRESSKFYQGHVTTIWASGFVLSHFMQLSYFIQNRKKFSHSGLYLFCYDRKFHHLEKNTPPRCGHLFPTLERSSRRSRTWKLWLQPQFCFWHLWNLTNRFPSQGHRVPLPVNEEFTFLISRVLQLISKNTPILCYTNKIVYERKISQYRQPKEEGREGGVTGRER